MLRPVYKDAEECIMLKDIISVEFKINAYTQVDIDKGSSGIGGAALGYAVGG